MSPSSPSPERMELRRGGLRQRRWKTVVNNPTRRFELMGQAIQDLNEQELEEYESYRSRQAASKSGGGGAAKRKRTLSEEARIRQPMKKRRGAQQLQQPEHEERGFQLREDGVSQLRGVSERREDEAGQVRSLYAEGDGIKRAPAEPLLFFEQGQSTPEENNAPSDRHHDHFEPQPEKIEALHAISTSQDNAEKRPCNGCVEPACMPSAVASVTASDVSAAIRMDEHHALAGSPRSGAESLSSRDARSHGNEMDGIQNAKDVEIEADANLTGTDKNDVPRVPGGDSSKENIEPMADVKTEPAADILMPDPDVDAGILGGDRLNENAVEIAVVKTEVDADASSADLNVDVRVPGAFNTDEGGPDPGPAGNDPCTKPATPPAAAQHGWDEDAALKFLTAIPLGMSSFFAVRIFSALWRSYSGP